MRALVAPRIMSSRKRLIWRTLREASDRPFLCASSSSRTTIGKETSCSSKRKIAVGSCISTLVSSTKSRRRICGDASRVISLPAAAGPGSERLRRFKYFLRVARHLHFAPLALQHSVAIEQEGAAHDAHELAPVHALLVQHVKELRDLRVLIRQELKGQFVTHFELLVRGEAVARDADDARARLAE